MSRVSTYGNFQSALLDLMAAQSRGVEVQKQVATRKIATDLAGFGRQAETLTALKSTQARLQGFIDTGETVAARLAAQDLAFAQVADGVQGARQAIADAIAAGRTDGLMNELQAQFQMALGGLNSRHQGRYLFAGGRIETLPVTASTLADLAAAGSVEAVLVNDQLRQTSRVDEGVAVQTGYLASEIGHFERGAPPAADSPLNIFRDLQQFHEVTEITGRPDEATLAFLSDILGRLDQAHQVVTNQAAANGAMQNRIEAVLKSHDDQKIALEGLLSKKTDVDMARALTELEMSQIAIQASARVVDQLRQSSLLNYLR